MGIKISFDAANNPEQPTFVLAKRGGDKIGVINATSVTMKDCLNDASEITFNVYKEYDGEKCPIWDKIVDFKLVYCVEWNMWFEITVETNESSETVKTVYCTQLGHAELSQINLYNIQINTEDDIARKEYDVNYPTILYRPTDHPEASLLHRILEKAPHYSVVHVDDTIAGIQRTFEFDETSIYDAFQEIAEEIGCIFILDSKSDSNGNIMRTISVYDLQSNCNDCKHRGEFVDVCPKCGGKNINHGYGNDTGIFITSDEIAEEIQISRDTDQIKNCFKLEGGDDMMNATIKNCNPNGSDYIWYIPDYMREDMSSELVAALDSYDKKYEYYYKNKNYMEYTDKITQSDIEKYNAIIKKYGDALKDYMLGDTALKNVALTTSNKEFLLDVDKKTIVTSEFYEYFIPPSIVGFPSLIKTYYDAMDVEIFLRSAMMPTWKLSNTTATIEAGKLTSTSIPTAAAADEKTLANMSEFTAGNIVLSVAKVMVDSRYKVTIGKSSFDKGTKVWVGNFTVTNYSDKEDTATTQDIRVQLNADYENFVRQKLDKALNKDDREDTSISGLFKKDISKDAEGNIVGGFVDELKKYSLNRLNAFHDSCQTCIDILVEQGIADKETWSKESQNGNIKNLYDDLYQPYLLRMKAIENEMNVRKLEIEVISGVKDEDGKVTKPGLINNVEDVIDMVQLELDFKNHIVKNAGEKYWDEFCSFRREDKYENDNYISDGLGNAELIRKANEFINVARGEIYKSSELQTTISSDLYNLLAIQKFKPIVDDFMVGNWIRVMVDDRLYKLRLVEYEIDYDSLDSLSVEFADATRANSTIKSVEDVINQASSMATSYDAVKRQAKQGEKGNNVVKTWLEDGLDATSTKIIGGSEGQSQTWDSHGMLFRKFDEATKDYEPTQMKIINSTMAITTDNWKTTKTAVGEYYYVDPTTKQLQKAYGVNAETIVGRLIIGESLFFTNTSGNLSFDNNGLVATSLDKKKRVSINPSDKLSVFKIQHSATGKETDFTNLLSFTEDGNLLITGDIVANSLTLVKKTGSQELPSGGYDVKGFSRVALSGDYGDLINKPKYGDIEGTPMLSKVATTGKYSDLSGLPDLGNKFDTPTNNITAVDGMYLSKQTGGDVWKKADDVVSQNGAAPICGKAVYDYAVPKKHSAADAKKLLYINDAGSVTGISISELKTLLGM